jgi:hypothetical protein
MRILVWLARAFVFFTLFAFALGMGSAITLAGANTFVKAATDILGARTVMTATGSVLVLPFLFVVPLPSPATWSFLALSLPAHWLYQTALVRAMGPAAFKRRDTLEPWPEGAWCTPGTFIRAPMFGGDRFAVPYGKGDDEALFITIKDSDIIGVIEGDPLSVKTS